MLHRMLHWIICEMSGGTGHDIGGTGQLALRSLSTAAIIAVGRLEKLADVGRSDPALRGLDDHATTGSGPTRQSVRRTRVSEPLLVSVDEARAG
jgi:hypothetical protein